MEINIAEAEGGAGAQTVIYIFGGSQAEGYARVAEDEKLLPQIFEKLGYVCGAQGGYEWNWNAGCKCGCSPGFVLHGHFGKEVFVDA